LQIGAFGVFGQSVFSLSLLKYALLFSTCSLIFAGARVLARNTAVATAACLSLFFLPTIAWESQRDLTHSVLASTLSAATLWGLVQLQQTRRTRWYAVLGALAGLGLLSKFNYAIWLGGLLLAGLTLPEMRPAILDRRIGLVLGIALGIFCPVGLWMLNNPDLALMSTVKFYSGRSLSEGVGVLLGLWRMLVSLLSVAGPPALVYLVVFYRAPKMPGTISNTPALKLLLRAWISIILLLLVLIFSAKLTDFRERWFQPILVNFPVFAAILFQARLSPARLKAIFGLALLVMLTVALILPGRLLAAERLGREEPLTRPYAEIAAQMRTVIPPGSLLVGETKLLAGNLRLGLPDATLSTPPLTRLFKRDQTHWFLVWDARKTDDVPPALKTWAASNAVPNLAVVRPQYFSAPYHFHRNKQFKVGLLQIR
jgi:4-amino-4-deoxy-L-arabinose transferase-like glycosyltransferase